MRTQRIAGALLLVVCLVSRAEPVPQELASQVPQATLSGQATMRFLGFEIYRASLWIEPGFGGVSYPQNKFALELRYLRNFQGADIAKRSIAEMRRQDGFDAQQAQQWEQQMRALFPNVQKGDRITGVHVPGIGAEFYGNGKLLGEIRDPLFARLFFGIWLSPQTSEPDLRKDLLTLANGVAR
jgi:Chalcone isomerase-like